MAVSLFSPIIKQHEKIVGQYYSIMTIIPIVVTILITWFYSSAYKRKEELMAHRAIEAKTKNKELQDIQNKIRDKMYDQPILDYINEFNEK